VDSLLPVARFESGAWECVLFLVFSFALDKGGVLKGVFWVITRGGLSRLATREYSSVPME